MIGVWQSSDGRRAANGAASLHGNTGYRSAVDSDPTSPSSICCGWLCVVGVAVLSQALPSRGESSAAGFSGAFSPRGAARGTTSIALSIAPGNTVMWHSSFVHRNVPRSALVPMWLQAWHVWLVYFGRTYSTGIPASRALSLTRFRDRANAHAWSRRFIYASWGNSSRMQTEHRSSGPAAFCEIFHARHCHSAHRESSQNAGTRHIFATTIRTRQCLGRPTVLHPISVERSHQAIWNRIHRSADNVSDPPTPTRAELSCGLSERSVLRTTKPSRARVTKNIASINGGWSCN